MEPSSNTTPANQYWKEFSRRARILMGRKMVVKWEKDENLLDTAKDNVDAPVSCTAMYEAIDVDGLEIKSKCYTVGAKHYIGLTVSNCYTKDVTIKCLKIVAEPVGGGTIVPQREAASCSHRGCSQLPSWVKCPEWKPQVPLCLQPHEEQSILLPLRINVCKHSSIRNHIALKMVAVIEWQTICAHEAVWWRTMTFRLPQLSVRQPLLAMMASCESPFLVGESFRVHYTVTNNLQDYMTVSLKWDPRQETESISDITPEDTHTRSAIICHQPATDLGTCQQGSTITVTVAFTSVAAGIFEVGQMMKLTLTYASTRTLPQESLLQKGHNEKYLYNGHINNKADREKPLQCIVLVFNRVIKHPCQVSIQKP